MAGNWWNKFFSDRFRANAEISRRGSFYIFGDKKIPYSDFRRGFAAGENKAREDQHFSWLKKNNPEKYKEKLAEKKARNKAWKEQKKKYVAEKYGVKKNKKSS